jgi:predicted DCC family thiol-disulfide oxidoreductase YuxK
VYNNSFSSVFEYEEAILEEKIDWESVIGERCPLCGRTMKLLGHSDYHMTLRYGDITQETVGREYFEALSRIEHRYADVLNNRAMEEQKTDPLKILADLVRLIANRSLDDPSVSPIARAIIKRIQRIEADILCLFPVCS